MGICKMEIYLKNLFEVTNWLVELKEKLYHGNRKWIKERNKKRFPIPGIEPEPLGWKPSILATRPYGIIKYALSNKTAAPSLKLKPLSNSIQFLE